VIAALHRKLLRELWRLRGQMLSIASLVACGVATVVSMHGTLRTVERACADYYVRSHFADVFASTTRTPTSLAARIAAIDGVGVVEVRDLLRVSLDVPGLAMPAGALVVSVPDHGAALLDRVHLRAGRLPRARSADEAVVSEGFAGANAIGIGDSIGAVLEGRWRRLHVVGIGISPEFTWELSAAGSFTVDERAFGVLWMSRTAVEAAAGLRGAFDDVALTLAPGANPRAVIAALDSLLAPSGGRGAVARERQRSHQIIEAEMRQLRVFGITLPLVFLAVTAFLLDVVLARLIATQRTEIAALKAFGYTDREIGAHYLAFAMAAVLLGAAIGVPLGAAMGIGYTGLYTRFFRFPSLDFRLDAASALAAVAASAAAALLGAWSAVRGAVRLPPAEALRPESPERYHPLLLERLGVAAALPPAARMVLRTVERRPLRAASSVLGLALAVGLLAGTMALFDAAYFMADVIFRVAQREDLSVTFAHARPVDAAVRELARIPGVLLVEPFRAVPVRVRSGSVVRTVAITGVDARAALHRVSDVRGAVYAIPPDGAVVGASLARLLGTRRGDTLPVELIERGGARRRVPVAALVDDMVGTNVYMSRDALDRLAGDGALASGAYLRVDPAAAAEVMARLKRVPAIASAASRGALIAAWERQISENIRISGTTIVTFGVLIALGVVYNGARIALSERGRELASLRVLGFSRREVAAMLYGEQAALLAAALPVGVLLGTALSAGLARAFVTETQRFPHVTAARTYLGAIAVVVLGAVLAGLAMRRRLDRMDLVAVLKTRE